ncbi:MAG: DUF4433 domain-containing protein [Verrucomicrobia bacterium]|jgi:hypothetical protein|nr:DUF4433 domain-containing protein [Verrucomicrobiota bacterium]
MTVKEFQCIMPIRNIPSAMEHGIVSHDLAERLDHVSVALEKVQDQRAGKHIPGGGKLHSYANIYFHARNPMMSRRRDQAEHLCVLRVKTEVLSIPGTVITDQNAASRYVKFLPPSALSMLDLNYIYAEDWKHPDDQIADWKHSSAKCAEVLVPERVPFDYIDGAYTVNKSSLAKLREIGFTLPITIEPDMFFR